MPRGKQRKREEEKSQTCAFTLDPHLLSWVDGRAKELGFSRSQYLQQLLRQDKLRTGLPFTVLPDDTE